MGTSRALAVLVPTVALSCLGLIGLSSWWYEPSTYGHLASDFPQSPLIRGLAHWDAGWYASLARDGYWHRPGQQSPVAFFPGYPLAIGAAIELGLNRWLGGAAITLLCGLLAVALFARWARTQVDQHSAALAATLLAVYPFAFYLYGTLYADALFLLLVVGAFLALERGQVVLATLLGAIATGTRPLAPAVVIGLVVRSIELRRLRGERVRAIDLLPALSVAGLALYMAFLGHQFDDPLAFAHVQAAPGWDQGAGWRTWLKIPWFQTLFPRVAPLVAFRLVGHALLTLGALALIFPTRRLLGWGDAAYVAVAVGLPALSSKDFQGLGRYLIAAFPLFLTVALLLKARPRLRVAWLVASACLLFALAAAFGAGAYVA